MAEFSKVAREWKRMCNEMCRMDGCEDCPVTKYVNGARCGDMPCEMENIEGIEEAVMTWAAENPEPIYPTWEEWLRKMDVVESVQSLLSNQKTMTILTNNVKNPIPADIAEKLGIQPKEG